MILVSPSAEISLYKMRDAHLTRPAFNKQRASVFHFLLSHVKKERTSADGSRKMWRWEQKHRGCKARLHTDSTSNNIIEVR